MTETSGTAPGRQFPETSHETSHEIGRGIGRGIGHETSHGIGRETSDGIGRGINFGNALDAAGAGGPELPLHERYFDEVRTAGFDTVRLPACWSAHADADPPYAINPDFLARVDRAVDTALRHDLSVVLDVHHYHELQRTPARHAARFVALWRQIAARYADRSDQLIFELLNEPRDALTGPLWNRLLREALAAVRTSNPERAVIVGPVRMNDVDALPELDLPADDHLIATIHYYAPMRFTHQGAHWTAGADQWLGTTWGADPDQSAARDAGQDTDRDADRDSDRDAGRDADRDAERDAVRRDLTAAARWAREREIPLLLGEFGTYDRADMPSRLRWTAFVRAEAERLGMSWCYWDFGTDFGAYDIEHGTWREPLLHTLFPAGGRPRLRAPPQVVDRSSARSGHLEWR